MAKKKKWTYKDIKKPDEFIISVEKVFNFLRQYYVWIITGVAVIAVAMITVALISYYREQNLIKLGRDFNLSFSDLMPLTKEEKEKEQAKKDEEKKKKEEEKKQAAESMETKKEENKGEKPEEKKEEKKEEKSNDKMLKVLRSLDGFIKNKGSEAIVDLAKLSRASVYLELKEYSKAIGSYNEFIEKYPDSSLRSFIFENIGLAEELSGNIEEAIKNYEKMAITDDSLTRAKALMLIGDLYNPNLLADEKGANAEKSKEYYEKAYRELGGEEKFLPSPHLIVKRLIEEKMVYLP